MKTVHLIDKEMKTIQKEALKHQEERMKKDARPLGFVPPYLIQIKKQQELEI